MLCLVYDILKLHSLMLVLSLFSWFEVSVFTLTQDWVLWLCL